MAVALSVDTVTLDTPTTVAGLSVQPGGTLVESATRSLTVTGELNNSGTLTSVRTVSGTGHVEFGLSDVSMNVTFPGSLSSVAVNRVDSSSPNGDLLQLEIGRYWGIQVTGSGFSVDLTFPYDSAQVPVPLVARWDGALWTASRSSLTPNEVTLNGVTEFSDWTISTGTVPVEISAFSLE